VTLDRREVLAGSAALLASCASGSRRPAAAGELSLDALLEAHADALPENKGGANHYPMAAETLEALDRPDAIEAAWVAGASAYAGPAPQMAVLAHPESRAAALGDYERYGDWLDFFRAELAREPWRAVVARWTPRLAPGVSAAVFHGVIRTAHAVRALRRRETRARQDELATALAYWTARYAPLETADDGPDLRTPLAVLQFRWVDELEDVPFHDVHARLARAPIAPRVTLASAAASAEQELDALVRESAASFLEMLVLERHRLWLLHTVTGPAAAALLVPELDAQDAQALALYSRQAVAALYVAFGAPHTPGAQLRATTPPWSELTNRAAESRSVHTIKLVEALARLRDDDDALCRSVAAQWFEWT
jgi:hypothetical protein